MSSSLAIGGDEILPLSLRGVAETDPALSGRYYDVDGFYSFRPPTQWSRDVASPRGGEKDPWRWRVLFRAKGTGSTLEVGVKMGGPGSLDKTVLSRYMGDFVGGLRRSSDVRIDSSGLYLFDRYRCILVKGHEKGHAIAWFSVFDGDMLGEHLQGVVRSGTLSPVLFEKVWEAVLASVRWPDLKHGQGEERDPFPESSR